MLVNGAVAVAAILWLVKLSQRQKSISLNARWWLRLKSMIAEQLFAVVYQTIGVAIESKPRIIRTGGGPGQPAGPAVSVHIEDDAASPIREIKAVA